MGKANDIPDQPQGLTDEQIAAEEKFLRGLPYLNLGALFMPPIWGPGHGSVLTILFYPLWIFCDNVFYAAYATPGFLSISVAVVVFVTMALVTVGYARLSQPQAWHRAYDKGKTKEEYLKSERVWAVAMGALAVVLIAVATWFNLCVRAGL